MVKSHIMKRIKLQDLKKIEGGDHCSILHTIYANNCLTGGALAGTLYGYVQGGST